MIDLEKATDDLEQRLRADHPHLAAYLDLTILVRPIWQYGFDVLGSIYPTAEEAEEARRAAVMFELMRREGQRHETATSNDRSQ
jgi:hypothetical protein